MEDLYKLLMQYEINIRYLSRCSSLNYMSIFNYFRRLTIPCYGTLPHLLDSAIKMCDQEIAKFSSLKHQLSLLNNKDYIEDQHKKDMEEKLKRNMNKITGKRKFGLSN